MQPIRPPEDSQPTNQVSAARLISYQDTLRAIGHWLDSQEAEAFSLFETPDDVVVVLEKPVHSASEHHFTPAHLTERLEEMQRSRADAKKAPRGIPGFGVESSGYRDFFRALGFELDHAGAHGIILVKVADQFLLTYSYMDPVHGAAWLKRRITIDEPAMAEIMNASRSRRRWNDQRRRFWPL
ncbi:MAG TPA: hypothetical protein VFB58_11610 [Chloroflexota bacterium]|nr:hypothetical protein [Chloroflexota bacterium]